MANPIIFDDGGSIRIRTEILDDGRCTADGLLNVDLHREKSPPRSTETVVGPYTHITGCTICKLGGSKPIVDSPLIPGDHFTIHAANHQCVIVRIDDELRCVITLTGADGNPPIVDLSQFDHLRQFKVVNAGPIRAIDGVANRQPFEFNAAECKSIYTALIVRDDSEAV
jgi:hypothetical protein